MRRRAPPFGVAAALLLLAGTVVDAEEPTAPVSVAVFNFELVDLSIEGELLGANDAEAARLELLGRELRDAFAAAPGYALADIAPVAEAASAVRLHRCRDCDIRLAGEVGADLAVTGTVRKLSNLIMTVEVRVREVASGATIKAAGASIRGNTDQSWRRGLAWLLANRLDLSASP